MDEIHHKTIYKGLHNYIRTLEEVIEELKKENEYLKNKTK
jgi:hypothetical protein